MLTPNQTLQQGRYRIIKPLGRNGRGAGYEAFDNKLEINVLLKELASNSSRGMNPAQMGEAGKRAFSDGARILTAVKHESLLHIQDYFSEADRNYLVAESLDGENLGEILEKRKNPFALSEIREWADQLLDALHCLHNQMPPIIHGRISPQSVKLTASGRVKLSTFDIARTSGMTGATGRTQAFDAVLMSFSPLEQIWESLDVVSRRMLLQNHTEKSQKILEQPADAQSDLFALGATLYYLATARLPVEAVARSIDILEGKADPLPTPNQLNPAIPPEVSDVIMRALEIEREYRYSSAVIMRQVLRTAFVQVQEREAQEKKINQETDLPKVNREPETDLEDDLLEIPFAPSSPSDSRSVTQEENNLADEPEQKESINLTVQQPPEADPEPSEIEPQLSENKSETERLETEELAPEVEKPLPENEPQEASNEEFIPSAAVTLAAVSATPDARVEKGGSTFAAQDSSDESDEMFALPKKENKLFKSIAASALALIAVGGAAWAIWNFALAGGGGGVETQSAVTSSETAPKPAAPTVENSPAVPASSFTATNASEPETNAANTAVSVPPAEKTDAPVNLPTQKVKPAPQVKKPDAATAKTPEKKPAKEKKAVTLDDLIN